MPALANPIRKDNPCPLRFINNKRYSHNTIMLRKSIIVPGLYSHHWKGKVKYNHNTTAQTSSHMS